MPHRPYRTIVLANRYPVKVFMPIVCELAGLKSRTELH